MSVASALTVLLGSSAVLAAGPSTDVGSGLTFDGLQTEVRNDDLFGSGSIVKNGDARLILNGSNTYQGGTLLNAGALVVGNAAALGIGTLQVNGASVLRSGASAVALGNSIGLNANLTVTGFNNLSLNGVIQGHGQLIKSGRGTLTLGGANTWVGGINLSGGTLAIDSSSALGSGSLTTSGSATLLNAQFMSLSNAIAVNGELTLKTDNALTLAGQLSGSGKLIKAGADELVLVGNNSFSGSWDITTGAVTSLGIFALGTPTSVNVGAGANLNINGNTSFGALTGHGNTQIGLGSTLSVGGTGADSVFAGTLDGNGSVTKVGSGVLELSGNSNLAGTKRVNDGTLNVTGTLNGGTLTVDSGATLTGTGSIGGLASVANGGHLAGTSGSTLSLGSLTLSPNSLVDVALGSPVTGNVPLFSVAGTLTLDGTLNVTDAGGFGNGVYRLFEYSSLLNNSIVFGNLPGGVTQGEMQIQTAIGGQVNLLVNSPNQIVQFWDGAEVVPNASVEGGSGVWSSSTTNWTNINGITNDVWREQFAVFQGAAGVVTVDGPQTVNGMQFMTDGYVLTGDALNAVNRNGGNFAVRVDPGVTATLGLEVKGTGTLNKLDNGSLVLNGNNSYSGGTILSGGTLVLGNGSALGSGVLATANGTTLDNNKAVTLANHISLAGQLNIGGSNALTLDGTISGSGGLTKNGSETLTLNGVNSYSGGTTISAGTLVASAASLGSGAITNNAALELKQVSAGNLAQSISGSGALHKAGSGKLTLMGTNAYSGGTFINSGTMVAASNSALGAGDVTVNAGAALEVASGTALAVGGNLTFHNGSTYRVYADPNSATSSHIDVTGTADLAGSVLHVGNESNGATDFQAGKKYTILTAGSISGTFGAAKSSFAYLEAKLDYSIANQVDLELKRKSNGGNNGGQMHFADLASTSNQGAAANAIESLPSSHPLYQHIETLPAGTPAAVFTSLSGDAHSTVMGSVNMLSAQAPNISQQHLRSNLTAGLRAGAPIAQSDGPLPASAFPSSKALPAWVEVVGHWQKMDGNSNTPGVKQNTTGLFLGADEEVGNSGWRVGGSVGYTSADAKVSSRDASADISSYSAAVYTGKGFSHGTNRINVIGGLAYTKHSIESERSVAALNQNLQADYSAHTAQLFAEVGYAMGQYDKQGFEPFVGITLGEQRTNSFKESGGFAALSSESSRDTLASTTLGVRAHSDFVVAGKDTRVRASLGVRHAWGNLSQNRTMAFEGSSSFTVAGAPLARNTALVGLQAEVALSRYSALVLGYNGEYGSGSRDQSASVKVRWAF